VAGFKKKIPPRKVRLATGAQLWVLNREGLLALVPVQGEPLTNARADEAIRESMAADPSLTTTPVKTDGSAEFSPDA